MKKNWLYLFSFLIITLLVTSCGGKDPEIEEGLLIGTWQRNNSKEYYKYLADHSGGTWDENDDVTEEEALPFTWNLSKDLLTQYHKIWDGSVSPMSYTITKLTSSSLTYRDEMDGAVISFTKVRN